MPPGLNYQIEKEFVILFIPFRMTDYHEQPKHTHRPVTD